MSIAISGFVKLINKALYFCSALLILLITLIIIIDVAGRNILNLPLTGTVEIVSNTIILIAFLQLSYSIQSGGMFSTSVVSDRLPPLIRRAIKALSYLAGAFVFAAISLSSWEPMLHAWETKEFFGGGNFRVITYPVRSIIVFCSCMAVVNYLLLAGQSIFSAETQETSNG